MTAIALTRKRTLIIGAVVLAVGLVATFSHLGLTRASAGPLRHDDTLQTTKVDETWQARTAGGGPCLDISFSGTVSGNARSTWGLTGPSTVWENVRVHHTHLRVEPRRKPDAECIDPASVSKLVVAHQWKTEGGEWHGGRATRRVGGAEGIISRDPTVLRLEGGAYDRDEAYHATLGVYVGPHWSKNGGGISNGVHVEHTVELPAG